MPYFALIIMFYHVKIACYHLSSSMYEKTYLSGFLEELLKLFKCLAPSNIHTISKWLDLLFKTLHQEIKRKNKIILTRLAWAP